MSTTAQTNDIYSKSKCKTYYFHRTPTVLKLIEHGTLIWILIALLDTAQECADFARFNLISSSRCWDIIETSARPNVACYR